MVVLPPFDEMEENRSERPKRDDLSFDSSAEERCHPHRITREARMQMAGICFIRLGGIIGCKVKWIDAMMRNEERERGRMRDCEGRV
jgi:hypothetical protein